MSDTGPIIRNVSDTPLWVAAYRARNGAAQPAMVFCCWSQMPVWERIVKRGGRCGILQSPSRHTLPFHPEGDTKGANPSLTLIDTSYILSVKRCGQPSVLYSVECSPKYPFPHKVMSGRGL